MNHSTAAPVTSTLPLRLRNLLAAATVIALACAAYSATPLGYQQRQTLYGFANISFTGAEFLKFAALSYGGLLGVYFVAVREATISKSFRSCQLIADFARSPIISSRRGLSREDRLALLSTLLKAFFGPLMVMSLMAFCVSAISNGLAIVATGISSSGFRELFDRHGFWFVLQLILFVDVLLFTVGYLVELPRLGNQIRSVDPTLLGWAAALLCYPPFNKVSSALLGSPVTDFPQFEDATAHLVLNVILLLLLGTYASASVALGFKASNLTHRGIVTRGPYRLIRHPAYTCKNMAWWIGSAPLVSVAFHQSTLYGIQTLASVVGWTFLYVLRALTEEDHLRGVDNEYAAYAAKVRWRFLPGVV